MHKRMKHVFMNEYMCMLTNTHTHTYTYTDLFSYTHIYVPALHSPTRQCPFSQHQDPIRKPAHRHFTYTAFICQHINTEHYCRSI